jgi:ABC-type molybdate transport system ATPase subunit
MNLLPAVVRALRVHEGVSLVRFGLEGRELVMVGLEPPRGLKEGSRVTLGIKATHLILSRHLPEETTLLNALEVRFEQVRRGEILAAATLGFGEESLEAILPREALDRLAPREGERLYALFQAAELSVVSVEEEEEK